MQADLASVARPATGRRIRFAPLLSAAFLLLVAIGVIAGKWLAPRDPDAQDPGLSVTMPGQGHLLGTDQLGRDVFSQLLAGTAAAVIGPLAVALGCVLIGVSLGMAAAYFGGVVDTLVNRLADLVYALPALLIAIVVVGVVGGGYWISVGLLVVLSVPAQIRLCRSAAMVQVRLPYVDAARTAGLSPMRTMVRHVLPNILPIVVTTFLLDFVSTLIAMAALSFLGVTGAAGSPDWGTMLANGQPLVAQNPWLSITPAVLIIATAASATLLGDTAHEWLTNKGTAR
ncbi:ABC transporter permease [Amycolatopsis rubida]|uniref:Peptide/nickel transport system permease protein/glutathione transport system permease protein n=1 Tax=Amycolatopsis rubida TaxID=112413 RepID=A0A1I5TFW9_9PSEU|nr:ABC transporter permease [Amycolatopsis rubida]SFP81939.1 peptide/nickel transport system permease protein/glutathione transport system permease protein [Amycolatopsis rubida]